MKCYVCECTQDELDNLSLGLLTQNEEGDLLCSACEMSLKIGPHSVMLRVASVASRLLGTVGKPPFDEVASKIWNRVSFLTRQMVRYAAMAESRRQSELFTDRKRFEERVRISRRLSDPAIHEGPEL